MSRVAEPSIEADLANYAAVTHQAMSVYLPDTEPRQYLRRTSRSRHRRNSVRGGRLWTL